MIQSRAEFQDFFENNIKPRHEEAFAKGKKMKTIRNSIVIAVPILVFVLYNIWLNLFSDSNISIIAIAVPVIILLIGLVIFFTKRYPDFLPLLLNNNSAAFKAEIMNDILTGVLPEFSFSPNQAITEEEFDTFGLVSRHAYNEFHSEDTLVGTYKGIPVRISECKAVYQKEVDRGKDKLPRIDRRTMFEGLALEFYSGHRTDFALTSLNEKTRKKTLSEYSVLEELSFSAPYFDENFKVQTNNSMLSRKLLQPKDLSTLSEIIEQVEGEVSFSFVDGKTIILINRSQNLFEIFDDNNYEADKIWDELLLLMSYIKIYNELTPNASSVL